MAYSNQQWLNSLETNLKSTVSGENNVQIVPAANGLTATVMVIPKNRKLPKLQFNIAPGLENEQMAQRNIHLLTAHAMEGEALPNYVITPQLQAIIKPDEQPTSFNFVDSPGVLARIINRTYQKYGAESAFRQGNYTIGSAFWDTVMKGVPAGTEATGQYSIAPGLPLQTSMAETTERKATENSIGMAIRFENAGARTTPISWTEEAKLREEYNAQVISAGINTQPAPVSDYDPNTYKGRTLWQMLAMGGYVMRKPEDTGAWWLTSEAAGGRINPVTGQVEVYSLNAREGIPVMKGRTLGTTSGRSVTTPLHEDYTPIEPEEVTGSYKNAGYYNLNAVLPGEPGAQKAVVGMGLIAPGIPAAGGGIAYQPAFMEGGIMGFGIHKRIPIDITSNVGGILAGKTPLHLETGVFGAPIPGGTETTLGQLGYGKEDEAPLGLRTTAGALSVQKYNILVPEAFDAITGEAVPEGTKNSVPVDDNIISKIREQILAQETDDARRAILDKSLQVTVSPAVSSIQLIAEGYQHTDVKFIGGQKSYPTWLPTQQGLKVDKKTYNLSMVTNEIKSGPTAFAMALGSLSTKQQTELLKDYVKSLKGRQGEIGGFTPEEIATNITQNVLPTIGPKRPLQEELLSPSFRGTESLEPWERNPASWDVIGDIYNTLFKGVGLNDPRNVHNLRHFGMGWIDTRAQGGIAIGQFEQSQFDRWRFGVVDYFKKQGMTQEEAEAEFSKQYTWSRNKGDPDALYKVKLNAIGFMMPMAVTPAAEWPGGSMAINYEAMAALSYKYPKTARAMGIYLGPPGEGGGELGTGSESRTIAGWRDIGLYYGAQTELMRSDQVVLGDKFQELTPDMLSGAKFTSDLSPLLDTQKGKNKLTKEKWTQIGKLMKAQGIDLNKILYAPDAGKYGYLPSFESMMASTEWNAAGEDISKRTEVYRGALAKMIESGGQYTPELERSMGRMYGLYQGQFGTKSDTMKAIMGGQVGGQITDRYRFMSWLKENEVYVPDEELYRMASGIAEEQGYGGQQKVINKILESLYTGTTSAAFFRYPQESRTEGMFGVNIVTSRQARTRMGVGVFEDWSKSRLGSYGIGVGFSLGEIENIGDFDADIANLMSTLGLARGKKGDVRVINRAQPDFLEAIRKRGEWDPARALSQGEFEQLIPDPNLRGKFSAWTKQMGDIFKKGIVTQGGKTTFDPELAARTSLDEQMVPGNRMGWSPIEELLRAAENEVGSKLGMGTSFNEMRMLEAAAVSGGRPESEIAPLIGGKGQEYQPYLDRLLSQSKAFMTALNSGFIDKRGNIHFRGEAGARQNAPGYTLFSGDEMSDLPIKSRDALAGLATIYADLATRPAKDKEGNRVFGAANQLLGFFAPGGTKTTDLVARLNQATMGLTTPEAIQAAQMSILKETFKGATQEQLEDMPVLIAAAGRARRSQYSTDFNPEMVVPGGPGSRLLRNTENWGLRYDVMRLAGYPGLAGLINLMEGGMNDQTALDALLQSVTRGMGKIALDTRNVTKGADVLNEIFNPDRPLSMRASRMLMDEDYPERNLRGASEMVLENLGQVVAGQEGVNADELQNWVQKAYSAANPPSNPEAVERGILAEEGLAKRFEATGTRVRHTGGGGGLHAIIAGESGQAFDVRAHPDFAHYTPPTYNQKGEITERGMLDLYELKTGKQTTNEKGWGKHKAQIETGMTVASQLGYLVRQGQIEGASKEAQRAGAAAQEQLARYAKNELGIVGPRNIRDFIEDMVQGRIRGTRLMPGTEGVTTALARLGGEGVKYSDLTDEERALLASENAITADMPMSMENEEDRAQITATTQGHLAEYMGEITGNEGPIKKPGLLGPAIQFGLNTVNSQGWQSIMQQAPEALRPAMQKIQEKMRFLASFSNRLATHGVDYIEDLIQQTEAPEPVEVAPAVPTMRILAPGTDEFPQGREIDVPSIPTKITPDLKKWLHDAGFPNEQIEEMAKADFWDFTKMQPMTAAQVTQQGQPAAPTGATPATATPQPSGTGNVPPVVPPTTTAAPAATPGPQRPGRLAGAAQAGQVMDTIRRSFGYTAPTRIFKDKETAYGAFEAFYAGHGEEIIQADVKFRAQLAQEIRLPDGTVIPALPTPAGGGEALALGAAQERIKQIAAAPGGLTWLAQSFPGAVNVGNQAKMMETLAAQARTAALGDPNGGQRAVDIREKTTKVFDVGTENGAPLGLAMRDVRLIAELTKNEKGVQNLAGATGTFIQRALNQITTGEEGGPSLVKALTDAFPGMSVKQILNQTDEAKRATIEDILTDPRYVKGTIMSGTAVKLAGKGAPISEELQAVGEEALKLKKLDKNVFSDKRIGWEAMPEEQREAFTKLIGEQSERTTKAMKAFSDALLGGADVTKEHLQSLGKVVQANKSYEDSLHKLKDAHMEAAAETLLHPEYAAKEGGLKALGQLVSEGVKGDEAQRIELLRRKVQDTSATSTYLARLRGAAEGEVAQEQEPGAQIGRQLGSLSRRLFGGFGLMYARSIAGLVGGSVMMGYPEAIEENQIFAGAATAAFGGTMPINPEVQRRRVMANYYGGGGGLLGNIAITNAMQQNPALFNALESGFGAAAAAGAGLWLAPNAPVVAATLGTAAFLGTAAVRQAGAFQDVAGTSVSAAARMMQGENLMNMNVGNDTFTGLRGMVGAMLFDPTKLQYYLSKTEGPLVEGNPQIGLVTDNLMKMRDKIKEGKNFQDIAKELQIPEDQKNMYLQLYTRATATNNLTLSSVSDKSLAQAAAQSALYGYAPQDYELTRLGTALDTGFDYYDLARQMLSTGRGPGFATAPLAPGSTTMNIGITTGVLLGMPELQNQAAREQVLAGEKFRASLTTSWWDKMKLDSTAIKDRILSDRFFSQLTPAEQEVYAQQEAVRNMALQMGWKSPLSYLPDMGFSYEGMIERYTPDLTAPQTREKLLQNALQSQYTGTAYQMEQNLVVSGGYTPAQAQAWMKRYEREKPTSADLYRLQQAANLEQGITNYQQAAQTYMPGMPAEQVLGWSKYFREQNYSPWRMSVIAGAIQGNQGALNMAQAYGVQVPGMINNQVQWWQTNADFGQFGGLAGLPTGQPLFATSMQWGNPATGGLTAEQSAAYIWGSNWRTNDFGGLRKTMVEGYSGYGTQGQTVGGIWGVQSKIADLAYQAQQASAGISLQQLATNYAFTTGVGISQYTNIVNPQTGQPFGFNTGTFGFNIPGAGSYTSAGGGLWGLQDTQRYLGYAQQQWQFGMQQQQINLGAQQFAENQGFARMQTQTQRGWQLQDYAYQDLTRGLQRGWALEDFEENVRFLTGRERRLATRQMRRETTMYNLETGQIERGRSREEQTFQWEQERFDLEKKHFDENKRLQQESLDMDKKFFEQRKKLEEESVAMQRAEWVKQQELQKEAIGIQMYIAQLQNQYRKNEEDMRLKETEAQAHNMDYQVGLQDKVDTTFTKISNWLDKLAEKTGSPNPPDDGNNDNGGGPQIGDTYVDSQGNTWYWNGQQWIKLPKQMASGGDFEAGETIEVGEMGPEVITPTYSGRVIPHPVVNAWNQTTLVSNVPAASEPSLPPVVQIFIGEREIKEYIVQTVREEVNR